MVVYLKVYLATVIEKKLLVKKGIYHFTVIKIPPLKTRINLKKKPMFQSKN